MLNPDVRRAPRRHPRRPPRHRAAGRLAALRAALGRHPRRAGRLPHRPRLAQGPQPAPRPPGGAVLDGSPDNPFEPVIIRGRVVEWLEGDAAWEIVDRIAAKYIGAPYPRDRSAWWPSSSRSGRPSASAERSCGAIIGAELGDRGWRTPGCGRAHLPQPGAGRAAGGAGHGVRARRRRRPRPGGRAARHRRGGHRQVAARRRAARAGRRGRHDGARRALGRRRRHLPGGDRGAGPAAAPRVALDDPALRPYRAALRRLLPGIADEPLAARGARPHGHARRGGARAVRRAAHAARAGGPALGRPGHARSRALPRGRAGRRAGAAGGDGPRRRHPHPPSPASPPTSATLALHRLDAEGVAALAAACRGAPLSAAERDELVARADGLPLLVEELLAVGPTRVPPSMAGLVAGRLAALPPSARAGGARRRGGRRHRLAVAGRDHPRPPRRRVPATTSDVPEATGRRRGGGGRGVAGGGGRRAARRRRRAAALPPRPHPRRRARHPAAAGARGAGRPGRPRARRRAATARSPPGSTASPATRPAGRRSSSSWPARTWAGARCAAPPPSSTRRASTPRPPSACTCSPCSAARWRPSKPASPSSTACAARNARSCACGSPAPRSSPDGGPTPVGTSRTPGGPTTPAPWCSSPTPRTARATSRRRERLARTAADDRPRSRAALRGADGAGPQHVHRRSRGVGRGAAARRAGRRRARAAVLAGAGPVRAGQPRAHPRRPGRAVPARRAGAGAGGGHARRRRADGPDAGQRRYCSSTVPCPPSRCCAASPSRPDGCGSPPCRRWPSSSRRSTPGSRATSRP